MLATSSRTYPLGWFRSLLHVWFGWMAALPWAASQTIVRQPVVTVRPTAQMRTQAHLRNLDQRLYPIPASRAHLYARAADDRF
jgi:hypothetical protein